MSVKMLLMLFGFGLTAVAQRHLPTVYDFNKAQASPRTGTEPGGNFIALITVKDDTVLIGSGGSLSITYDHANSFDIFTASDGIFKGSLQAAAYHKGVIYLTTIYDTLGSASNPPTYGGGGGLSISRDLGSSWQHVPQGIDYGPFETLNNRQVKFYLTPNGDTVRTLAVTTRVDNVSFDIAVTDTSIWMASFAGGLRRASLTMQGEVGSFFPMPIPPDNQDNSAPASYGSFIIDPLANFNHRVFSVIAASNGIWAGSAGGINHSTDGGESWTKYTAQNSAMTGNFVVAIAEQVFSEAGEDFVNIWAATNPNSIIGPGEFSGVSVTSDTGQTWRVVAQTSFVHNIAFSGKTVHVATEDGMLTSQDLGNTWVKTATVVDAVSGDRNVSPEFPAVGVDTTGAGEVLYFGSVDGLAVSTDGGNMWKILRSRPIAGQGGQKKSFAYPNPFSPTVEPNVVRFEYDKAGLGPGTTVTVRLYDFALDLVATVTKNAPVSELITWNGRANNGKRVANGTYIYTIQAGSRQFWGKLTVRN